MRMGEDEGVKSGGGGRKVVEHDESASFFKKSEGDAGRMWKETEKVVQSGDFGEIVFLQSENEGFLKERVIGVKREEVGGLLVGKGGEIELTGMEETVGGTVKGIGASGGINGRVGGVLLEKREGGVVVLPFEKAIGKAIGSFGEGGSQAVIFFGKGIVTKAVIDFGTEEVSGWQDIAFILFGDVNDTCKKGKSSIVIGTQKGFFGKGKKEGGEPLLHKREPGRAREIKQKIFEG
jgi:hypothetical protein